MKHVTITGRIEKAELFDRLPPLTLNNFWLPLFCRGGSLVDHVRVHFDNKESSVDCPAEYGWYPRTLIKKLLLVRVTAILAHINPQTFKSFFTLFSERPSNKVPG